MQIIVLGMHRSGTSLVTRLINLMGAYIGESDELMEVGPDNPTGFWERKDVIALNDRILEAGGGAWWNVVDYAYSNIDQSSMLQFQDEIREIAGAMDDKSAWVLKDPRMCMTLPVWLEALDDPICVSVFRNPVEVARSLHRRNALPIIAGIGLWELYTLRGLEATREVQTFFVNHAEMLADPIAATQRLYEELAGAGVDGLQMPAVSEVEGFVDPALSDVGAGAAGDAQYLNGSQAALANIVAGGTDVPGSMTAPSAGGVEAQRVYIYSRDRFEAYRQDVEARLATANDDMTRLRNWLASLDKDLADLFQSWRWRVGHTAISVLERLLLRGKVGLVKDHIMETIRQFRKFEGKLDQESLSELVVYDGVSKRTLTREEFVDERHQALTEFLASGEHLAFPAADSPRVSVVLVLYNRAELTLWCLRSLLQQRGVTYEVIMVDNSSTDQTAQLMDRIEGAKVIENDTNAGFVTACNQGVQLAGGDYVLLLNNDAKLLEHTLRAAVNTIENDKGIGVVGGKIVRLDGLAQEGGSIVWNDGSCLGYGRGESPWSPGLTFRRDVDYCSGAFLLTPRELFVSLGGLDECYSPAYYEDTDYCMKVAEAGYRVVYEPDACLVHFEFASSASPEHAVKLQKRNRKVFCEKHASQLARHFAPSPANILMARFATSSDCKGRVLYIDDRVPHRSLGSGFPRSNRTVTTLLKLGYRVTVYPLNFPNEDNAATTHVDLPKETEVILGYGRSRFKEFMRQRQGYFDVIVVSRPHNMEFFHQSVGRQRQLLADVKVVYDAEALFALREVEWRSCRGETVSERTIVRKLREETRLAATADAIITVSEKEKERFIEQGDQSNVYVLGHALQCEPTEPAFDERDKLLFVGNLDEDDAPNVDSLVWFVEKVLPRLENGLEEAELHVVGSCKSKRARRLQCRRVQLWGRVDRLRSFYEGARIFVAPTRFSAGIPYKIHEAAACGVPTVATDLLVSQLGWTPGEDLLTAPVNDAAGFAAACVKLYNDEQIWQSVRHKALKRIEAECSEEAFENTVARAFDGLRSG